MPQITIEISANVAAQKDLSELLPEIHNCICLQISVDPMTIKSRIYICDKFYIAHGQDNLGFINATVAIMPGRTGEEKKKLGKELVQIISEYFESISSNTNIEKDKENTKIDIQTRVLIQEIDADLYFFG